MADPAPMSPTLLAALRTTERRHTAIVRHADRVFGDKPLPRRDYWDAVVLLRLGQ